MRARKILHYAGLRWTGSWGLPLFTATMVALLFNPAQVSSHAVIVESSPGEGAVLYEAPTRIVLRFNSRIEKSLSRASLSRDGGKARVMKIADSIPGAAKRPEVMVIPLPPLPAGVYTLRFTVLAADGHTTPGILRFTIRERE